jgi:xanthine dehydrogenase accessory factor
VQEIVTDLLCWLADGEEIALATVVGAEGSSPRPLGARLAATASGHMAGSVSGGCVEGAVFIQARDVLLGGPPRRLRYSAADETGWGVGLACGGTIEVYVEPLVEVHRRLLAALEAEETVALATRLDGSGHLLAWPDGRMEGDRSLASELTALFPGPAARMRRGSESRALTEVEGSAGEGDVFLEVFAPPPTLVIVGAVHIAVPLVTLAQTLGFRVQVVDARRAFATQERFPTVDDLVVAWPQDALKAEALGPQHYVVILSHDPKFGLRSRRRASARRRWRAFTARWGSTWVGGNRPRSRWRFWRRSSPCDMGAPVACCGIRNRLRRMRINYIRQEMAGL